MDESAVDGGALAETVAFLSYFNDLPDVRQRGKVMCPLAEALLLCLWRCWPGPRRSVTSPGSAIRARSAAPALPLRGGQAGSCPYRSRPRRPLFDRVSSSDL
jgi:hypothetical protein